MAAYRSVFAGTTYEIRAEQLDRRRWVARTYVVQEGSLVLQACAVNGLHEFEGESEEDAVAQGISALCHRFGRPSREPLPVAEDPTFRITGRARAV